MFLENCKLALASIKTNKIRALLTMLGIIIGIGSVITIMTVGNSLSNAVKSEFASSGSQNIDIGIEQVDYEVELSAEEYESANFDTDDLKAMMEKFGDRIKAVSVTANVGSGTVIRDSKTANVSVQGVSAGSFLADDTTLLAGQYLSSESLARGSSTCMVADKFIETVFDGDNAAALGTSIEVNIDGSYRTYTIVGVYESSSAGMMASLLGNSSSTTVYIPLKNAWSQTHSSTFDYFTVVASTDTDAEQLSSDLKAFFDDRKEFSENLTTYAASATSALESLTSIVDKITLAISLIAAIALLVGGIGVMNIMTVSITERTKEIGTRKALGAPDHMILLQFITEAVILCLIGGVIGILLGIGVGALATTILGYSAHVSAGSILISVGLTTLIGVFFGFYPAKKAANMNPIDALRYE